MELAAKTTNLTPFSIGYLVILLILIMSLPRDFVLLPFFLVALYMTIGQRLVLLGLNMTILRIALVFSWARVLVRGEHKRIQPSLLDKWLVIWLLVRTVVNLILWRGEASAIIGNLGPVCDTAGTYFLLRAMIIDHDDLRRVIILVCVLAIPLSAMILIEHFTGNNPFSVFGGVPELTAIREGRLRCQGPFRSPILAGTFGATMTPFALSLVRDWNARVRCIGIASAAACLIITVASSSSGPLFAGLAAIVALLLWPARTRMHVVRRAIVLGLVALQLVMKAPIWYLIARMSDVLGMGGGYHRSALIDAGIRHFSEWALMGTSFTAHWMPYQLSINPNMVDMTNAYIGEGVHGGAISMVLFIGLLVSAYRRVGLGAESARVVGLHRFEITAWVVGASLTAHAITYLGITYFDQMLVFWLLTLSAAAVVGALRGMVLSDGRLSQSQPLRMNTFLDGSRP